MNEFFAVFRSRTHAIDCAQTLRSINVACMLTDTPRAANVGCGLSVKFNAHNFAKVKLVISKRNYPSFTGYLKM